MPELPPLNLLLDVLLFAVLPALVVAAGVTFAVGRLAGEKHGPFGAALGLAAGTALGFWLRDSLTWMPGDSSWNRLPWLALAGLWLARSARLADLTLIEGWLLRAALTAGCAWLVIPSATRAEFAWLMPAFALVVLAAWFVLELPAAQPPGGGVPFALSLSFFAASVLLIHAGSARLTDVATVLSAALAGVAAVAWWRGTDASSVAPAVALLLPGVLLTGQQETFSEVPWTAFALAAGAPLMLAPTFFLRDWKPIGIRLVQLGLALIPLGIAIFLAAQTGPLQFE